MEQVPDQRPQLIRWQIRIFAATWLTYAGLYFCRHAFYVVKKNLQDAHSWDPIAIGNLGIAYLVAYAVGQFVSGALGNKYGSRILLLTGMLLSLTANFVFGTTNSFATVFLFMIINGLAQSTGWSNTVGNMGRWFRREKRGTIMGFWSTCYQLGGILAKSYAALLLGHWGWRSSFYGASLILLAVWCFVLIFQRNKPEDVGLPPVEEEKPTNTKSTTATKPTGSWTKQIVVNVLLLGMIYFCLKFIRYAFWSWSAYFLQDSYGIADYKAGYFSALFDLGGFLGVIFAGFMSDKLFRGSRNQMASFMAVGLVLGCLFLWQFGARSVTMFYIGLFITGFMLYGPDSLVVGVGAIDVGSPKRAALAAGIINGIGSIGPVVQERVISKLRHSVENDPARYLHTTGIEHLKAIGPIVHENIGGGHTEYLNNIFMLLFFLAVGATIGLAVMFVKARRGSSNF